MHDIARITASYDARTEAFAMKMDSIGQGLGAQYGAKYMGAHTNPFSKVRTLEFEMSVNRGERAMADLEILGFGARLVVIA